MHSYQSLPHAATAPDSSDPTSILHRSGELPDEISRNNTTNRSKSMATAKINFDRPSNQDQHLTLQIYWLSPTKMIGSFLLGTGLAIGHHIYYQSLNGQTVGSFDRQQWSLRFGNAFAISSVLCLKTAVGLAYAQVLWRRLGQSYQSIRTINASFDILGNLWSFLNLEIWAKIQVGLLLALVLWCLPVPALFATPTLSIGQSAVVDSEILPALVLDIYNGTSTTIPVTSVVGAVSYTGNTMPFILPSTRPNFTYHINVNAPLLRCDPANATDSNRLIPNYKYWEDDQLFSETTPGEPLYLAAYSIRPIAYSGPIKDVTRNKKDTPPKDALLIAIQKNQSTDPKTKPELEFIRCDLWSTTLDLSIRTTFGVPKVDDLKTTWLTRNTPSDIETDDFSLSNNENYQNYIEDIGDYVNGYAVWHPLSDEEYLLRDGRIFESIFLSGSQFNDMLVGMKNRAGKSGEGTKIPPPLRNITFARDVEQFALNVTLSMFSTSSFCKEVATNVTFTTNTTVYAYQPRNLLISYGLAILFTFVSVVIGGYAIYRNGASYDTSFSSISIAIQSADVKELLGWIDTSTAQPLSKDVGEIRLRFDPGRGFVIEDVQE